MRMSTPMPLAEQVLEQTAGVERPACIIASNRGPVECQIEEGKYKMQLGSGGLVTALLGATQQRRVVWIALTMTQADRQGFQAQQELASALPAALAGVTLRHLSIPEDMYDSYYYKISNAILWFAQHMLLDPALGTTFTCQTRDHWEQGYRAANEAIAAAVIAELENWGPEMPVILQDYQLYLVPEIVRARYPSARLGQVIYIPWPDARYLALLPDYMVQAIYSSLAMNDSLGFQTVNDARNFLAGATRFLPAARVSDMSGAEGSGALWWRGRRSDIRVSPATLSVPYLRSVVQSQEAEDERKALHTQLSLHRSGPLEQRSHLIVRVDRIEPTKNIVRGFLAYEHLLQQHPELHGRITFLALLVPSRASLASYQAYEDDVRDSIARINRQYGREGWQPVLAVFGNNRVRALTALQDYDILFVNPVIDGLNLVVKEGGVLNRRSGVIVLSRTVGVYDTLGEHVVGIAPLDIDATAEALYYALTMAPEERQRRAEAIRQLVLAEDATRWFGEQIEDLCHRDD